MGVYELPYTPVSNTPYPVIVAQPTFWSVFKNMTLGDYGFFFGTTAFGAAYGFACGARRAFLCPALLRWWLALCTLPGAPATRPRVLL